MEVKIALPAELAELIPADAPEWVGVGWGAEWLEITPPTILAAIRNGRIPALEIPGAKGVVAAYAIRPSDAVRLWGPTVLRRRAAAATAAQRQTA